MITILTTYTARFCQLTLLGFVVLLFCHDNFLSNYHMKTKEKEAIVGNEAINRRIFENPTISINRTWKIT